MSTTAVFRLFSNCAMICSDISDYCTAWECLIYKGRFGLRCVVP